jgi:hypothetical protein
VFLLTVRNKKSCRKSCEAHEAVAAEQEREKERKKQRKNKEKEDEDEDEDGDEDEKKLNSESLAKKTRFSLAKALDFEKLKRLPSVTSSVVPCHLIRYFPAATHGTGRRSVADGE